MLHGGPVALFCYLLLLISVVQGQEKPELTVGVKAPRLVSDGKIWGKRAPFQPSLQFTQCGSAAGCDIAAGIDLTEVRPGSLSYSLFGRVKRSVGGWNYRLRLNALSSDLREVRGFLQTISPTGSILVAEGFASMKAAAVTNFKLEQPFQLEGASGSIGMHLPIERAPPAPPVPKQSFLTRYIWGSPPPPPPPRAPFIPSVTLRYNKGPSSLIVSGNQHRQSLTLVQRVLPRTTISPTVATDGTWQVGATQNLGNAGALSTTIVPGRALIFTYGNFPFHASVVWNGRAEGATVMVRRSVPAFS